MALQALHAASALPYAWAVYLLDHGAPVAFAFWVFASSFALIVVSPLALVLAAERLASFTAQLFFGKAHKAH